MLGIVGFVERREEEYLSAAEVEGLLVVRGAMAPPGRLGKHHWKRQIRRLEQAFSRYGVRRVWLPEGDAYPGLFSRWSRVDPMPLYRDLADLLALALLEGRRIPPKQAVVTLAAPRVTRAVEGAAERLGPCVRGLALDVPGEGERFAGWLHREYGIAVYPPEQGDVTLDFGRGRGGGQGCIDLSREEGLCSSVRITARGLTLPDGDALPILSLLWECGRVKRSQIRVNWVDTGISS